MSASILRYGLLFLVCVLLQVLIFNNIVLFHVAVPIVFIYFIIHLPINLKLSYVFTFSFLLGLIVDVFSDTPGVNALACTLTSALRIPIYYAYVAKDDVTSRQIPTISTLGIIEYSKYLLTFIVVYCLLAFSIEYFSFADVKEIAIMTGSSAVLTFILLLAFDSLIPE
ncbi:MAG: rod shape-determining protein MreD [Muribaculaceae bacterium]|nr:rod shape-determining protein MreD [Muribaculaceae bacterium]